MIAESIPVEVHKSTAPPNTVGNAAILLSKGNLAETKEDDKAQNSFKMLHDFEIIDLLRIKKEDTEPSFL